MQLDRTRVGVQPQGVPSPDDLSRGVGRVVAIFGSGRDCVPRALAVFSILTRYGYEASFVSGVRLDGDELRSHSWVEVTGLAVPRASDTDGLTGYTENFRHTSGDTVPTESP